MIKLIIFDLDGVLVEAKEIHYKTLNNAIEKIAGEKYVITESEHLSTYDGLKTYQKLDMLTNKKGLPADLHVQIWNEKQSLTIDAISQLEPDYRLISIFTELRKKGIQIACCSNSIRRSVLVMLSKIGLIEYMDLILSNEDVKNSKPHPEIYWKAMSMISVLPEETLIVEDSPHGLLAASRSRAHVLRVANPQEVKLDLIIYQINDTSQNK